MTRKAKPRTEPQLSAADRAALELALETARKLSPADRQQIDTMLKERSWREVAVFASHSAQEHSLRLQPWECWPPCKVEVGDTDEPGLEHRSIRKSAALLRRMLALGISRWHPDPVGAIEAAEAERTLRPSSEVSKAGDTDVESVAGEEPRI
jgi:hypothetical protein